MSVMNVRKPSIIVPLLIRDVYKRQAKKKAFIVTVNGQESEFAMELKERYGDELKKEQFECPLCGGRLVKRSGPYGEFFGCSNYRTNGCNYKRKIR